MIPEYSTPNTYLTQYSSTKEGKSKRRRRRKKAEANKEDERMASAEEEGRRLFVGGLNGATTDATFRAHFASFFPVANAEVSKHIYVSNPSIILKKYRIFFYPYPH